MVWESEYVAISCPPPTGHVVAHMRTVNCTIKPIYALRFDQIRRHYHLLSQGQVSGTA